MAELLDRIESPRDLHLLTVDELTRLAEEIRGFITHSVSRTGGHLASNLGVVETAVAMHYVFDFSRDHLLFDVGHQCYAHKVLTGRKDRFSYLRKKDGLSGFPDPHESPYDRFKVGHAGTAIATALGMALAGNHKRTQERIVAFVGDASIVNGTSFEAINNLGLAKRQLLVVLNDNSMAIDVTPGAIAEFLAKVRLNHTYEDIKKTTHRILKNLPLIGEKMDNAIENFKRTLRMAITPNKLFESLNIPYFGPVDGHDMNSLIELFRALAELETPAILHVYTKKGMGFMPADDNPTRYHSTGPFKINGNEASHAKKAKSYTAAFAEAITEAGRENEKLVAVTAAMPDGTGLIDFRKEFPDRFYDVGIAESAAVDIAAGMAKEGIKPFVCIYSTFLQRAYDHIFQEVALQNLPVVFCIDRAGVVGSDGPTHHGLTDIAFLSAMPNMTIIAPANETELRRAVSYASYNAEPVAIRYPKDNLPVPMPDEKTYRQPFEKGKSLKVRTAEGEILLVALGAALEQALAAADILSGESIEVDVINARFAKPVDPAVIEAAQKADFVITLEDHGINGGFGSAILNEYNRKILEKAESFNGTAGKIITLGAPDRFVPAASRADQLDEMGISCDKIANLIRDLKRQYSKPSVQDIC